MEKGKIIAIDTNYWVRYLVRDNLKQAEIAKLLLERGNRGEVKLMTSWLVFFEVKWVLGSVYEFNKKEIVEALELILQLKHVKILKRNLLTETIKVWETTNLSFEDCYLMIEAKDNGAEDLATFDAKLKKKFLGFNR